MFVSFLMPFESWGAGARHLAVFYRQLRTFRADDIAFVGSHDYFRPPAELEAAGRPEWRADWREAYEYEPPTTLHGVRYAALPDDLFAAAGHRLGTPLKVYRHLLTRRMPELEAALSRALDEVAQDVNVEGLLSLVEIPSVRRVARERGIPVIQYEMGPIRKPDYTMTAYWDLRNVNRRTDAARRFQRFCRELQGQDVPLLTREELLRAVRRTPVSPGPPAAEARFRIGIALQGEEDAYASGIGALDLITLARSRFAHHEVLIRHHPAGWARYTEGLGTIDDSPSPTDFLLQCEMLLTANSGTALEALLLGRRCVVLGDSPFSLAADVSMDTPRRRQDDYQLVALNFLVFGYLVPYALLFDTEYVRWRLLYPPEIEIVRVHQRWYRNQMTRCLDETPDLTLSAAAKLLDAVPTRQAPEPIFLFGAGHATPALIDLLRPGRFTPLAVFDNDEGKWGSRIRHLPVTAPIYRESTAVVVSSLTHADAIVSQLRTLGYSSERILRLLAAA